MHNPIKIITDVATTFSLAAQQNAYPLIKVLRIEYDKAEHVAEQQIQKTLQRLRVVLQPISGWLEGDEWLIDSFSPGQVLSLPKRDLKFLFDTLFGLTEEITLDLQFDIFASDG
ncbi:MAG: hypothetical protein ABW044_13290, partial [Cellvibrio sp.]